MSSLPNDPGLGDERAGVEDALAKRALELASLSQFSGKLYRAETLTDIYEAALDAIFDALHCSRASILLFDDAGVIRFVAWRGLSDAYRKAVEGHSPWTSDAKDPQPICIDHIDCADVAPSLKSVVRDEGIHALAFIPLVLSGKLIGKFMTYYDSPHAYTSAETELALIIARQLAFSIRRTRAEEALRESERRLEFALTVGQMGAWEWDIGGRQIIWSPGLEIIHGLQPGSFGGQFEDFKREIHPDDLGTVLAQIQQALETGRDYHVTYRMYRPDGAMRWLEAFGRLVRGADDQPQKLAGICMDITERKRTEEREKLLVGELQHRTNNLFAVVQALAHRSLSGDHTLDEAREAFVARLSALARADQRLTNSAWKGSSLNAIIIAELQSYAARIKVDGSEMILGPLAAQNFTLALHELATNASKYGALSVANGKVTIGWSLGQGSDGGALKFRWQEHGGPPVSLPSRMGFGTSLLKATLGEGRIDFATEGLIYEVDVPISMIASAGLGHGPLSAQLGSAGTHPVEVR